MEDKDVDKQPAEVSPAAPEGAQAPCATEDAAQHKTLDRISDLVTNRVVQEGASICSGERSSEHPSDLAGAGRGGGVGADDERQEVSKVVETSAEDGGAGVVGAGTILKEFADLESNQIQSVRTNSSGGEGGVGGVGSALGTDRSTEKETERTPVDDEPVFTARPDHDGVGSSDEREQQGADEQASNAPRKEELTKQTQQEQDQTQRSSSSKSSGENRLLGCSTASSIGGAVVARKQDVLEQTSNVSAAPFVEAENNTVVTGILAVTGETSSSSEESGPENDRGWLGSKSSSSSSEESLSRSRDKKDLSASVSQQDVLGGAEDSQQEVSADAEGRENAQEQNSAQERAQNQPRPADVVEVAPVGGAAAPTSEVPAKRTEKQDLEPLLLTKESEDLSTGDHVPPVPRQNPAKPVHGVIADVTPTGSTTTVLPPTSSPKSTSTVLVPLSSSPAASTLSSEGARSETSGAAASGAAKARDPLAARRRSCAATVKLRDDASAVPPLPQPRTAPSSTTPVAVQRGSSSTGKTAPGGPGAGPKGHNTAPVGNTSASARSNKPKPRAKQKFNAWDFPDAQFDVAQYSALRDPDQGKPAEQHSSHERGGGPGDPRLSATRSGTTNRRGSVADGDRGGFDRDHSGGDTNARGRPKSAAHRGVVERNCTENSWATLLTHESPPPPESKKRLVHQPFAGGTTAHGGASSSGASARAPPQRYRPRPEDLFQHPPSRAPPPQNPPGRPGLSWFYVNNCERGSSGGAGTGAQHHVAQRDGGEDDEDLSEEEDMDDLENDYLQESQEDAGGGGPRARADEESGGGGQGVGGAEGAGMENTSRELGVLYSPNNRRRHAPFRKNSVEPDSEAHLTLGAAEYLTKFASFGPLLPAEQFHAVSTAGDDHQEINRWATPPATTTLMSPAKGENVQAFSLVAGVNKSGINKQFAAALQRPASAGPSRRPLSASAAGRTAAGRPAGPGGAGEHLNRSTVPLPQSFVQTEDAFSKEHARQNQTLLAEADRDVLVQSGGAGVSKGTAGAAPPTPTGGSSASKNPAVPPHEQQVAGVAATYELPQNSTAWGMTRMFHQAAAATEEVARRNSALIIHQTSRRGQSKPRPHSAGALRGKKGGRRVESSRPKSPGEQDLEDLARLDRFLAPPHERQGEMQRNWGMCNRFKYPITFGEATPGRGIFP